MLPIAPGEDSAEASALQVLQSESVPQYAGRLAGSFMHVPASLAFENTNVTNRSGRRLALEF